jgi:capsular polysaccharide biosynthesis protein
MNDALTMASFHGAGFTNLMYAAPDARVVELGTLQSGMLRLGDFAGLAHASGADYSVAIADYEYDGNRVIPPMRGHGLYPVRITDQGVDRLVEHILDQA